MPSWKYKTSTAAAEGKRGVEILIKSQLNPPAAPTITCVSALERLAPYDAFFGSQANHEFSLQVCTMLEPDWSIFLYHIHHHVGA